MRPAWGRMTAVPVALFLFVIALSRMTDEMAGGTAAVAIPVFLMFYGICMIAARMRVKHFVRIYYKNQFYINAKESSMRAMYHLLLCSAVCALLLIVTASPLSHALTGSVKGRLSLYVCAMLLPLLSATSVQTGFLEGMGVRSGVMAADITRAVLTVLVPLPLAMTGYLRLGKPLDALLFTEDCGAAYALAFAFAGLLLTECVVFVIVFVMRRALLRKLSPLHETGKPKFLGDQPAFFGVTLPLMVTLALPFLFFYIQCILFHAASPDALSPYAGHFLPLCASAGLLCAIPFLRRAGEISERERSEEDKERSALRIIRLFRRMCIFCLPAGIFLMALAETVEGALFLIPDDTAILLLTTGGLLLPLITCAVVLSALLTAAKKTTRLVIAALIPFAAGTAVCAVMALLLHTGIFALLVSALTAYAVFDVLTVRLMLKIHEIRGTGLFQMVAGPLSVSAGCAILIYLLSHVLRNQIGEIPTCILCVLCGGIVYMLLMAAIRAFAKGDLTDVPFGGLLERISLRGKRS